MKTKDLQNLVLSKRQNGQKAATIFRELEGQISIKTVRRWIKMIDENGAIDLHKSPGRKRAARTTTTIQTTKRLLKGKKKVTVRKLRDKLGISYGSAQSILTKDLRLKPYKKRIEPNLSDDQKKIAFDFITGSRTILKNPKLKGSYFRTRNGSRAMASTTVKMIEYWQ
jgi:transposase